MSGDISDYWSGQAADVRQAYLRPDTMNSVRLRIVMDLLARHRRGRILDAGCGSGTTTQALLDAGWDAFGVDASPGMVKEANARLQKAGYGGDRVKRSSLTELSAFPDGHFDAVMCIGVMYYIKDDVDAYAEIHRILKPGGIFLCSYQNEMFDLFTFNRYTRRFFKRNIFPLIDDGDDGSRADELDTALSDLMTNPDAPIQHDDGSARDAVFTRPENPLVIAKKVAANGFEMTGGPYYHGIHIAPPLVEKAIPGLAEESMRKQYDLRHDWRSLFMAAHFLVEAQRRD